MGFAMLPIRPVVISGPSGCGKSSLLKKLFSDYPDIFAFSVSHTTRGPRPGEVEGKDYYFVSKKAFKNLSDRGGFLEQTEFSSNFYGTSKMSVKNVMSSRRLCFIDVEINGVKNFKESTMHLKPRFLFVKPPNMNALRDRLEARGSETADSLQRRLATAKDALDYADEHGAYDKVIVNDDFTAAYDKLKLFLQDDIRNLLSQAYTQKS